MKPTPPDSLLGRGQTWVVAEATNWGAVTGWECTAMRREGDFVQMCRYPSVIMDIKTTSCRPEALCEEHMGYHRWIDSNGIVMQWRADPPWVSLLQKITRPVRKTRRSGNGK